LYNTTGSSFISILSIYSSVSLPDRLLMSQLYLSPLPIHAYQAPRFNPVRNMSSAMPSRSVAVSNPLRASILVPPHPSAFTGAHPLRHCRAHCGGESEMNLNGILHQNSASVKTTYSFFTVKENLSMPLQEGIVELIFSLSNCDQCHAPSHIT